MHLPFDFDRDCSTPYGFVPVEPDLADPPIPEAWRSRILIDTVHDGGAIPSRFRVHPDGTPIVDQELLVRRFIQERDWGANLVAGKLAAALGLPGFHRVRLARVLMDFNRFPGTTPPNNRDPLQRLAIHEPFAGALDHPEKLSLLEDYYDSISALMEEALAGKRLKIGVHTYDEHNPSLTKRPAVCLISLPANYQRESLMPYGVFDPMFPDVLGHSTCCRTLRDRISLNLERADFRVGHNHPYPLPEGCVEVRSQVWYFFNYLRERFQAEFPASRDDAAYELVWTMLLNTNLRLAEAEAFRGFLHRYRRAAPSEMARFRKSQLAYEQVRTYLHQSTVLKDYRRSPTRPSSLVIEVRKDLVCRFDPETGRPLRLEPEMEAEATSIAQTIASAIAIYLETDRPDLAK